MNDDEKRTMTEQLRAKLKEELKQIKLRTDRYITPSNNFSMSSRAMKSDPPPLVALDKIFRVDLKDGSEPTEHSLNAICLDTLTFDTRKLYLRDLVIMVREIHAIHPEYSLRQYNCYWFARTLADILTMIKNPTTDTPKTVDEKAGCVSGIPTRLARVVQSNPTEVTHLVIKIESAIMEDDRRVSNARFIFTLD